jgi:RNA polymerase sigma factor (sigma-70 family)
VDPQHQSTWLLARWREGDQEAARELFYRYSERLIALVRTRLSDKVASRLDPEDVVQSVYRSFFSNARDNRYVLERSGDLWRLLVAMAMRKLVSQVRHQNAERRSVKREQPQPDGSDEFGPFAEVLGREPSPADASAVLDELEQLMRGLDPVARRILEMRLQGYRTQEIAVEVRRSDRMVRLTMEDVRSRLDQRLQEYRD